MFGEIVNIQFEEYLMQCAILVHFYCIGSLCLNKGQISQQDL